MQETNNQGVPYIGWDQPRYSVPDTTQAMAEFIEKRLNMRFSSVTDRNDKLPSAQVEDGMISYLENTGEVQVAVNGNWQTIFPSQPAITSGTGAPSHQGSSGDIYLEY